MKVTLLLCDWAEDINGKLYIMGGGWSRLRLVQPATMTLAAKIDVPWDETNKRHKFAARLLTEDGEQVLIEGQPVTIDGEFEVGRPVGVKKGSTLDTPLTLRFQNLMLPSGRYEWSLEIDGEPTANVQFDVETVLGQGQGGPG
jgi:hypothetical protein